MRAGGGARANIRSSSALSSSRCTTRASETGFPASAWRGVPPLDRSTRLRRLRLGPVACCDSGQCAATMACAAPMACVDWVALHPSRAMCPHPVTGAAPMAHAGSMWPAQRPERHTWLAPVTGMPAWPAYATPTPLHKHSAPITCLDEAQPPRLQRRERGFHGEGRASPANPDHIERDRPQGPHSTAQAEALWPATLQSTPAYCTEINRRNGTIHNIRMATAQG